MSTDDQVLAVLEQRARELARPAAEPEEAGIEEVLVVALGADRYGFLTRHVREVLPVSGFRRLPSGTGALRGVVAARGDVVPVADLADLLGRPASDTPRPYAVVLDGPADAVGLLVDDATDVLDVPAERVVGGSGGSLVELGVSDGTVILDAAALLHDPRLTVPTRRSAAPLAQNRQES